MFAPRKPVQLPWNNATQSAKKNAFILITRDSSVQRVKIALALSSYSLSLLSQPSQPLSLSLIATARSKTQMIRKLKVTPSSAQQNPMASDHSTNITLRLPSWKPLKRFLRKYRMTWSSLQQSLSTPLRPQQQNRKKQTK